MSDPASSVEQVVDDGFFVTWFEEHERTFPWRLRDTTPFQVLVTEMLLRQTQAIQVERLWNDFMSCFGTPEALLKASDHDVFECIEELGFGNQRTSALRAAAKQILEKHDGVVPREKEPLLNVPHVGPYSARAVQCFAFGEAVPIVDTNILRLFCRLTERQVRRPDVRRVDWAWEEAESLLPERGTEARKHNYGLLDFTAQICLPRSPECENCPLLTQCAYGQARLGGEEPTAPW